MNSVNNNKSVEYRWNDSQYLSKENFIILLQKFGDLLPDPLGERVDLNEYSEKWLTHADILLAFYKNEIVGVRVLYANDYETKSAHGLFLAVLPEFQGMGIGREMYRRTIDFVKQRGMTKIFLFVHFKNIVAINLYKSLGFIEVERENTKIKMRLDLQ